MSLKAIDDLLVKVQHNEPVPPVIAEKAQETESESPELGDKKGESDANEGEGEEKLTHLEKFRKDKEEFLAQQAEEAKEAKEDDVNDNLGNKKDDELSQESQEV